MDFARASRDSSCSSCAQTLHEELERRLEPILKAVGAPKLEWFAANANLVRQAPCRGKLLTDAELWKAVDALAPAGDKKVSKTVHGIEFKNESEFLVQLLEKLTTYEHWDSERKARNQRTYTSECHDVRCAVAEIFGEKEAPRLLFMLARYGFNGSHHAFHESVAWKPGELDDVLMGLGDWPASVLPIFENKKFTHYPRNTGGNGNLADATIAFYEDWSGLKEAGERQMIIFHEIGHRFGSRFRLDDSDLWFGMSGWEIRTEEKNGKVVNRLVLGNPEAIPSEYGRENPFEDFAESVVAYRYNPAALKMRSPEKYQLLKEAIFDGLEYISEEACRPEHGIAHKLDEEMSLVASRKAASPESSDMAQVLNACSMQILDAFIKEQKLDQKSFNAIEPCVFSSLVENDIRTAKTMGGLKHPEYVAAAYQARKQGRPSIPMGAIYQASRERLRAEFSRFMASLFEDNRSTFEYQKYDKVPRARFCEKVSKHAYQSADKAGLIDSLGAGDSQFAYRNSEFFTAFSDRACNSVLAEIPEKNLPDGDSIRKVVAELVR